MSDWQNGLFGCFNNCGLCIVTYFVPCYTTGKNAEAMGDSFCLYCCGMLIPLLNIFLRVTFRGKLRERQGIEGGFIGDCLTVWCCSLCSIVQEGQECKHMTGDAMAMDMERV